MGVFWVASAQEGETSKGSGRGASCPASGAWCANHSRPGSQREVGLTYGISGSPRSRSYS